MILFTSVPYFLLALWLKWMKYEKKGGAFIYVPFWVFRISFAQFEIFSHEVFFYYYFLILHILTILNFAQLLNKSIKYTQCFPLSMNYLLEKKNGSNLKINVPLFNTRFGHLFENKVPYNLDTTWPLFFLEMNVSNGCGQTDDLYLWSWSSLISSHFGAATSLLWRRGCTKNSELNLSTVKDSSLLHLLIHLYGRQHYQKRQESVYSPLKKTHSLWSLGWLAGENGRWIWHLWNQWG